MSDTDSPPVESREAAQPNHSSVRVRVLVGLASIMVIFSCLTIYSIMQHQHTVEKISIISSSYLPLIIGTSEISANQVVFNIFIDRLVDDPNQSVTREWIDAARRFRPPTVNRLVTLIENTLRTDIAAEEAEFLLEMQLRLKEVGERYVQNERRFQGLYDLLDTGHTEEARTHVESIKRVERLLNRVLSGIGDEVGYHIREIAEEAAYEGARATWGLGVLTLVGMLIAGTLLVSTNRLLAPLKTLQHAVEKVAMGDLSTRINVERNDEIGALASGFNRMTAALAERDDMLIRSERLATAGKMAAKVTHEIRNPLSSLGLNAELLEEELAQSGDADEAHALLHAMQDEIERLTQITESYLRFSRLPSPHPQFDDLNATVNAVLEFMNEEFKEAGVEIEKALNSDLAPIFFDRAQMRQALSNLLRNACEAMPSGGTIRVSTAAAADTVELTVKDSGGGVPDDAVAHIFKSFYSTKSSGTGLGLPLVRQICIAHGGDARLQTTGKEGSSFVISLPRTHPQEGQ